MLLLSTGQVTILMFMTAVMIAGLVISIFEWLEISTNFWIDFTIISTIFCLIWIPMHEYSDSNSITNLANYIQEQKIELIYENQDQIKIRKVYNNGLIEYNVIPIK